MSLPRQTTVSARWGDLTVVAGGKKPLSSSCPYIIADGDNQVVMAGGAAGGSTIISGNTQVARNVLVSEWRWLCCIVFESHRS